MIGFLQKLKEKVNRAESALGLPIIVQHSALEASKVADEEY